MDLHDELMTLLTLNYMTFQLNVDTIDHIANPQNDAWWECQGPFPSQNASNVALTLPTMHHFED